MNLRVVDGGLQTTIQGGPRIGCRHLGVPASGAADPLSLALANRLVNRPLVQPAFEITLAGPTFEFGEDCLVALAGADIEADVDGMGTPMHTAVVVRGGSRLNLGGIAAGMRAYLAVAADIECDSFLGNRSTYLPAALGGHSGRALRAGDVIGLRAPDTAGAGVTTPPAFRAVVPPVPALRATAGPERHRLGDPDALFAANWRVARRADRMGMALDGPVIDLRDRSELASAPVFPGTVQLPPGGTPFLLSVDAQTTGGYPRVAQVARADRHLLGQLRPGTPVRFVPRDPATAAEELRQKRGLWSSWLGPAESVF